MNYNYITPEELQNIWAPELDYTNTTPDILSGMISAASNWVDNITNADRGWEQELVVNEEYSSKVSCHTSADGNLHIPLIKRPLLNVTDVQDIWIVLGAYATRLILYSNPTTSQGVFPGTSVSGMISVLHSPSPGWEIIYPNTWLVQTGTLLSNQRLYNLRSFDYFIKITYKAGYATIPDDIKYATALRTQSIIAKKYNPMGAESFRQGSMSASYSKSNLGEDSFTQEAKVALRNYIRVV